MALFACLFACVCVQPAFAEGSFVDVTEEHWGFENIEAAKNAGIIEGYIAADGTASFRPDNMVTKQECITMLFRTLGLAEDAGNEFTEKHAETLNSCNIADWAKGYTAYFFENGWVTAEDFSEVSGDRTGGRVYASRQLIARWTANCMKYDIPAANEIVFSDHLDIDPGYAGYVNALYRQGIMEGSNGRFNPQKGVRRAEMAAVCTRLLGLEAREKHDAKALVWYGELVTGENVSEAESGHGDVRLRSFADNREIGLHISPDARIVIDGKAASADDLRKLAGKSIVVSTYVSGETAVNVQTKPAALIGTVVEIQDLIAYRLLTIKLEDGSLVNYIVNEDSQLPRRIVAGRDYSFIADGLNILELL